jgi:adenylylsulfate kinase
MSAGALAIVRAAYTPLALTGLAAAVLSRTRVGASVLGFCAGVVLVIGVGWLPTAALSSGAPQYASSYWETLFNGSEWTEAGRGTIGIDIAVIPEVRGMSPQARAAYYQQRFLTFVKEHPGDYAVLAFRKALWYWLPAYPEWSLSHRLGASAYYAALYAFALLGAALSIRSRFSWLLITCLAIATLTAMATIVDYDARYRLPAELLMIPFAATGVLSVWGAIVRSLVNRGQNVPAGVTSGQPGFTIWLTGLSGSGKSTIATALSERLAGRGLDIEIIDGDVLRKGLSSDLGFSRRDRDENVRRVGWLAALLNRHGIVSIVALVSPYEAAREEARARIGSVVLVHVDCPIDVLRARDTKGLYRKASEGQMTGLTGVDDPYEPPGAPDLRLDTSREPVERCVARILVVLEQRGYIQSK